MLRSLSCSFSLIFPPFSCCRARSSVLALPLSSVDSPSVQSSASMAVNTTCPAMTHQLPSVPELQVQTATDFWTPPLGPEGLSNAPRSKPDSWSPSPAVLTGASGWLYSRSVLLLVKNKQTNKQETSLPLSSSAVPMQSSHAFLPSKCVQSLTALPLSVALTAPPPGMQAASSRPSWCCPLPTASPATAPPTPSPARSPSQTGRLAPQAPWA